MVLAFVVAHIAQHTLEESDTLMAQLFTLLASSISQFFRNPAHFIVSQDAAHLFPPN